MSVSVVVPTFNRAALLPATLDCVLAQTDPAREIIVVDDGSEDGTAEVLATYGSAIRVLRIPNSGDLAARNFGLDAARGDLVAFCDSDDLWQPDYLRTMRALWRAEPGINAAYGDFRTVRDGCWSRDSKFAAAPPGFWHGLRTPHPEFGVFDAPAVERLIAFQPFFPSCLVADRGFLHRIGGWDEAVGRTVGTDFATVLRIAEHPPLGVLRRPLVGIRKHAGNYSADVQAMNLGDCLILEHVLRTRPSLAPLAGSIRASIAQRRRQALDTAFARHDYPGVRRIHALLPANERATKGWIKDMIAALPAPMRGVAARTLLTAGSLKARAGGATPATAASGLR